MSARRVRISNDSLNSYGSRVLTAGMNVEQYCRNPVLLYMHERGNVIGYVKDLKSENGEVTASWSLTRPANCRSGAKGSTSSAVCAWSVPG